MDGNGADDKGIAGVGVTSDPEVVFSGDKGTGVAERVDPLPPAAAVQDVEAARSLVVSRDSMAICVGFEHPSADGCLGGIHRRHSRYQASEVPARGVRRR